MPIATRAVALQEAVKFGDTNDVAIVLQHAELFHQFIMADEGKLVAPTAAPEAPAEPKPAKVKAPKAPAGEVKPGKSEEEVVAEAQAKARAKAEAADNAPTLQEVGDVAAALLKANLREVLVDLLGRYGAASVGKLPVDKYASFITAAKASMNKGSEADLLG